MPTNEGHEGRRRTVPPVSDAFFIRGRSSSPFFSFFAGDGFWPLLSRRATTLLSTFRAFLSDAALQSQHHRCPGATALTEHFEHTLEVADGGISVTSVRRKRVTGDGW